MNILMVYYLEKFKLKLYETYIVLELIELVIKISEFCYMVYLFTIYKRVYKYNC